MKTKLLVTILAGTALTFGTVALGAPVSERHHGYNEHVGSVDQEVLLPEMITWTGWVRCEAGTHETAHQCDLEFVRKDGEVFAVIDSPELKRMHCGGNADLKVTLTAEKTPRFLFWGGNLIAKKFEIVKRGEAGVCDAAYRQEQQNPTFGLKERLQDFDGPVNL